MDTIIFKIENIAQQWFALMTTSSIQLGLFLLLIFIITSIFKKQSAKFLYLVWLIGLLKIFIPPTIKLPAFFSNATIILDNQIPSLLIPEIHVVSASSATLSYQGYLFLAWAAVVLTLFCYWLFQLIRFRVKVTGTSIEIMDQNLFDTRILNGDRVRIFTGANISMPFTKGIFQPKIYLPESTLSWQVNELNALILHEYAHIKRKDLFFITLQNIMQMLFFFHPLVWLANRQISRYREKACDDFAIHDLQGKATEYGRLLLKSIDEALDWKPIPSMSISFHQSKKFLLQRFHYILNRKESIMTKLKLSQKLALIGLIIFGIALSCQKQTLKETISTNEKQDQAIQEKQQAQSFEVPDVPPMPIGGFEAIQAKLIYPEYARKSGVEGTVVVQAKIDTAGYVIDTNIMQSLAKGGCDEAAITAINAVKWKPAQKDGKPITTWVSIPVRFKVKATIIDAKQPHDAEQAKTFVSYDDPPQPIGGFAAIQENLVYPELARRAGIEGIVIVHAQVSESGEVIDTRILQSLGEDNGCDEAAVAAIKAVKWQPAKSKDQPVSVWVSIPVRFKLKGDSTIKSENKSDNLEEAKVRIKELSPTPPYEASAELLIPFDEAPEPIGGLEAIQKNLVYPELAQKAGVEGTVAVQVRIDENGEVVDTKVLKPLGNSGCNEAAVAAIKSVKWKPAKIDGKPIAVAVAVLVIFKLH
jgi:TonB family protein